MMSKCRKTMMMSTAAAASAAAAKSECERVCASEEAGVRQKVMTITSHKLSTDTVAVPDRKWQNMRKAWQFEAEP